MCRLGTSVGHTHWPLQKWGCSGRFENLVQFHDQKAGFWGARPVLAPVSEAPGIPHGLPIGT